MPRPLLVLAASLLALAVGQNRPTAPPFPALSGPYLGMRPPSVVPELFAPGVISTELHDDAPPAFSADGTEVFFRVVGHIDKRPRGVIYQMRQTAGRWSVPRVASFSGQYMDAGVMLSPDGRRVYFGSQRPLPGSTRELDESRAWFVERDAAGLTPPQLWDVPLNRHDVGSGYSMARSGTVYAALKTQPTQKEEDLYRMRLVNGRYEELENLGPRVNTDGWEGAPCIAPDEGYLVFNAIREGQMGLYVSFRLADGSWSESVRLGAAINEGNSMFAGVSPDGKFLFFVGHRKTKQTNPQKTWQTDIFRGPQVDWGGDVYWVSTRAIEILRPR